MRSPKLEINEEKTVSATKKYKRFVTGLILANDGSVSLGRDRKRRIRAALHHAILGRLDERQQVELAGLLAFVNDVEPTFLIRLEARYGSGIIRQLKAARLPQSP